MIENSGPRLIRRRSFSPPGTDAVSINIHGITLDLPAPASRFRGSL
jgi:hypothetical protein